MSYAQTLNQMAEMKLHGMRKAYESIEDDPNWVNQSFDDKLAFLVNQEYELKQNNRIQRYIKEAKFKQTAYMHDIIYQGRNINPDMMQRFANLHWLKNHENIILTGATGTGKSFLAQALGHMACQNNYRAFYCRVPELLNELQFTKQANIYLNFRKRIKNRHVLILDDWGMAPLNRLAGREIGEIIEDRLGEKSTIVVSQFPVDTWHQIFEDQTTADAIMDRLIHVAYVINLEGDSLRATSASKELLDFKKNMVE